MADHREHIGAVFPTTLAYQLSEQDGGTLVEFPR
jgi:hypothetical protein